MIPFHPELYKTLQTVAVGFEAILLSLALGDKINLMKRETNQKLEEKVLEQTKQLEVVIRDFEQLANTDRLTKVANRMSLDSELDKQLKK